jgi:hypothetical protein
VREKFAAYSASCIGCVARGLILMGRSRAGGAVVSSALLCAGWFIGETLPSTARVLCPRPKIEVEKIRDGEVVLWAVA